MTKLILSVFMLLAVSKSNGQKLKADTTSWGSIYYTEGINAIEIAKPAYDTIPVIFQYSDTSCYGLACPVLIGRGYFVKKHEPYKYYTGTYNTKYNDYSGWRITEYLLLDKKPIPATWVVWMALENNKQTNQ